MKNLTSLFLAQSYKDTWDDYNRSLTNPHFATWDYVVLTASNEHQAEGFRVQIEERRNAGFLPAKTKFVVIPDENGERVGSGGATLGVLRYLAIETGKTDFSGLCILVIHSGGDSKRVPQYSALGKLFSPVPHQLPNGRPSTLFDEFMIVASSMPARIREGMLLLSGDVLLLFNPLQVDYNGRDAAAISFKEDVVTGKNHGVFLGDEKGNVARFLHKQSEIVLKECGAVNARNCVDIDTGAIIFSTEILSALFGLIATGGRVDEAKYSQLVNSKVRLSLYGDFLYPLASRSTLEDFYKEKPEGEYCEELTFARTKVWNALRAYKMKVLRLAPAKFIHFGTTVEILRLLHEEIGAYEELGWENNIGSSINGDIAGYNSVLSDGVKFGKNCYLEVSCVQGDTVIGDNAVLSYIDIENQTIPSNIVLHGLKLKDGRFMVRAYGIKDDPKGVLFRNATLFGLPFESFLKASGVEEREIWDGEDRSLWKAKLYPVCDTVKEALSATLNLYAIVQGGGSVAEWKKAQRKSLYSGFEEADTSAILAWDKRMKELVQMDAMAKRIKAGVPARTMKNAFSGKKLTPIQESWIEKFVPALTPSEVIRLYYYLGVAIGGVEGDKYISKSFKAIQRTILSNSAKEVRYNENCRIVKDSHCVKLPLRVNWGGGWSDTPPYCHENGGTVINAAILLNGEKPVEVRLEKIAEKKIVFISRDMDVHGEFREIESLQETGNPYDPFALQKAALLSCGILPKNGGNLQEILNRLGGGFILRSEVTGVPKGSGLGTSSILSAACIKAIFEFMGIEYTDESLYAHVLCMEQIMSTGGGWQDQVGGITSGIKYITSNPGWKQDIKVSYVEINEKVKEELNERFALIYTGQRRLARNLLRDVVGRYIGNESEVLYALGEIQRITALMRFELEKGRIDEFAKLLNKHWELSKTIDAGSTNTLIDQIFETVEEFIDGKLICGAGGGGFLQVILKKGVTKSQVHQKLKEVFGDNAVGVWNATII